jgi:hypothetical protein
MINGFDLGHWVLFTFVSHYWLLSSPSILPEKRIETIRRFKRVSESASWQLGFGSLFLGLQIFYHFGVNMVQYLCKTFANRKQSIWSKNAF